LPPRPRQCLPQSQDERGGSYYAELAKRLKKHGFKDETEAGITMKLKRGTFSATLFLACIATLELEKVVLEEI
jgi:Domain of unknown function (DUF6471)